MTKDNKKNTNKEYSITDSNKNNMVKEPMAGYATSMSAPMPPMPIYVAQTGFSYNKFIAVTRKIPFTSKEWAAILHLSERTLQRYAQNNTSFDGIYTDRILHIEQLIEIGLATFASAEAFYNWLKSEKQILGQTLNFSSLLSSQGIQLLIDEVGRIQTGVYI